MPTAERVKVLQARLDAALKLTNGQMMVEVPVKDEAEGAVVDRLKRGRKNCNAVVWAVRPDA